MPHTPYSTAPPLSRRTLLRAAGVGTTVAAVSTAAPAHAAGGVPGLDPTDIGFHIVKQFRQLDLVGNGFETLQDEGDAVGPVYEPVAPDGHPGVVTRAGGRIRISGAPQFTLLKSQTGQVAPYAGVVVDVAAFSGDSTEDRVYAGLVKDAGNWVAGWYDHATGTAGIDVSVDGAVRTLGSADAGSVDDPCQVAFGLTSSTVVVFVTPGTDGSRPVPIVQKRLDGIVDLRRPAELAAYRNAFGAKSQSGTTQIDAVEAGYFGELGIRDPHLITHADGRPYIRDNKAYFTFTQAGLAFFETAHWGVWTVDLSTYAVTQTANLFFQRDGSDAVLGDHAGHIVRDEARGRWIVANSTWGDFSFQDVHVNYTTLPLTTDVLHGVHVLQTTKLALPVEQLDSGHVGQWDPHLVRIGTRWYVAFVNARKFFDFFPALSRSPRGADFTDLDLVGADYAKIATEGTVMQKVGNRWWLLASNGDDSPAAIRNQYPVYDLDVHQVGTLDAPHPTNIPWPMMFPVPVSRGQVRWVLLTFEGTQYYESLLGYGTHGDIVVMEGNRTTPNPFLV